ncbi:hypothetical protein QT970_12395, partial [Microcoleus sp. herbarium8]|uniref:hypothetical protein n=1 Tax=Microcoleus sp. herbarium8 TaxID=3055436 RepID=UPI002FD617EA
PLLTVDSILLFRCNRKRYYAWDKKPGCSIDLCRIAATILQNTGFFALAGEPAQMLPQILPSQISIGLQ